MRPRTLTRQTYPHVRRPYTFALLSNSYTVSDSLSLTEDIVPIYVHVRSVSDNETITELIEAEDNIFVEDTLSASESITYNYTHSLLISDTLTATEDIDSDFSHIYLIEDTLTVTESLSHPIRRRLSVSDTVSITSESYIGEYWHRPVITELLVKDTLISIESQHINRRSSLSMSDVLVIPDNTYKKQINYYTIIDIPSITIIQTPPNFIEVCS